MMMMMTVFNALGKENQLNRKHDANCLKPGDKSSKHQSYLLACIHIYKYYHLLSNYHAKRKVSPKE